MYQPRQCTELHKVPKIIWWLHNTTTCAFKGTGPDSAAVAYLQWSVHSNRAQRHTKVTQLSCHDGCIIHPQVDFPNYTVTLSVFSCNAMRVPTWRGPILFLTASKTRFAEGELISGSAAIWPERIFQPIKIMSHWGARPEWNASSWPSKTIL